MAITKVQLADPKAIIKLSKILGKKSICEKAFWKFFRSIEKKSILGGMANISLVGLIAEDIKKKIGKKNINPIK